MNREAFVYGIYPRSAELIPVTQGVSRGRFSPVEKAQAQEQDMDGFIDLQKELGFSYIEDGKFTWEDIFRPLQVTSQGFEHNGIDDGEVTRWFDTNTFYRKPVITGTLTPDFKRLAPYFPQISETGKWKVTLPSPFTFAKVSIDRTTSNFQGTLENVTQFMRQVIEHLESRGVSFVHLSEPYIPYFCSNSNDIDLLVSSLKAISEGGRKAIMALQTSFGDGAPILKALESRDTGIDVVGLDFLKTDISSLPTNIGHPLAAGVVRSLSSRVEDPEKVKEFLEKIDGHLRPPKMYATNNTALEFVSDDMEIARNKVRVLGEVIK